MNFKKRIVSIFLVLLLLFNTSGVVSAETSNSNPELVLNNPDIVNISQGNNYELDGFIKDLNVGDQLTLNYSLKKNGVVIQNHSSKELLSVIATGENQSINSVNLDMTGLDYGEYILELWISDNHDAKSSVITKTIVYSATLFNPVIDKFEIDTTTNNASFEYEGHSDLYALMNSPYQIEIQESNNLA